MSLYAQRRERVRRSLKKLRLDAILLTNPVNVAYLTGFGGDSSFLLLRRDDEILISDGRYTTQIAEECPDVRCLIRRGAETMPAALRRVTGSRKSSIAFEADVMSVALRDRLVAILDRQELVPREGIVESLRMIKDRAEIRAIRRAVESARTAFDRVCGMLHTDRTEKELRNELEYQMRLAGAETVAFPTIVAAGLRAALPHAIPTDTPIGGSGMLLIDFGAKRDDYTCDITRTIFPRRPTARLQKMYDIVRQAQDAAILAVRPGATCEDVDRAARGVIETAGFGKYFTHSTGHGFGREVHEMPRLCIGNPLPLRPGMVVTIEPGIYLPGWGGVRIEDDILVAKNGCEILTR